MVADLTCDVRGAVEALVRTSTVDEPFFVYDPATKVRTSECFGSLMAFVDL
jgi:hypothetical protein